MRGQQEYISRPHKFPVKIFPPSTEVGRVSVVGATPRERAFLVGIEPGILVEVSNAV